MLMQRLQIMVELIQKLLGHIDLKIGQPFIKCNRKQNKQHQYRNHDNRSGKRRYETNRVKLNITNEPDLNQEQKNAQNRRAYPRQLNKPVKFLVRKHNAHVIVHISRVGVMPMRVHDWRRGAEILRRRIRIIHKAMLVSMHLILKLELVERGGLNLRENTRRDHQRKHVNAHQQASDQRIQD